MYEIGDILETYIQIGSSIYGYHIVGFNPLISMVGSYNHTDESVECPLCDSMATCVVEYSYYSDWFGVDRIRAWYCKDCFILWEHIKIGDSAIDPIVS